MTTTGEASTEYRVDPQYGIREERDVFVPMRDGVQLCVDVFRPDADDRFPALLAMSPYGKGKQTLGGVPGRVVNVDATMICERPAIGPHRAEMERNLAEALSAQVSVKASTNEGMGWIGRGEGIACVAVALVDLR